ncbi:MAG: hypothetical protein ACLQM6_03670 [Acidobacteriaceae bacterium]
MSRHVPLKDFRGRRKVLVRSDFALTPKPPRRPSDRIDQKTWYSLVVLPDDVAIRTSNHHGMTLRQLDELSHAWIASTGMYPNRNFIDPVMLDANDDINAAIFNALVGYYRFSIGGMRNVLELLAIGCWTQVCGEKQMYEDWRKGKIALSLGQACDGLIGGASALQAHLKSVINDSLFDQISSTSEGGFVRRAFSGISEYSHSRPGHTDGDLWESNGPIYVPAAFNHVSWIHFEIIALSYVLAMLAKPKMRVLPAMSRLFADNKRVKSRVTRAAFDYLYQRRWRPR